MEVDGNRAALLSHLKTGVTTVCRCWAVTRSDGLTLGFTDHDRMLEFAGVQFRPDSGLSASVLAQTSGMAVDNTEAFGAISDDSISEPDLRAGRYDAATVRAWLVNWSDPTARLLEFKGTLGDIRESDGRFHADLRGLSDALNHNTGYVYQRTCSAILGDTRCGVDLDDAAFSVTKQIVSVDDDRVFRVGPLGAFEADWFTRGVLTVLSGEATGLKGLIKSDRSRNGVREIELWEAIKAPLKGNETVRITAGCDRRATCCREKFSNFLNFRGFPHIPGEDWLTSYPKQGQTTEGTTRFGREGVT